MRAPTASELFDVWERCAGRSPPERALELAGDDGALTVGELAVRLLELRKALFGNELEGVTACPACGEALEYALSAAALGAGGGRAPEPVDVVCDGYELALRLPTGADLVRAARARDIEAARTELLSLCVLSAARGGEAVAVEALPETVVAAVSARLAEADPQADVRATLGCPACGHMWEETFDAAAWLWAEVDTAARRTAREVHALASAYGWSEREILSLGWRRRLYLELVEG